MTARRRYPLLAALIEAALPDHASGRALHYRAVHAAIGIGAPNTTRIILGELAREGRALFSIGKNWQRAPLRFYRLAPGNDHASQGEAS
jgi:hypothetical protein